MTTLNRFITSTINACIPRTFTPEQVVEKLTSEIAMLTSQLKNADLSWELFIEKAKLLKEKISEREQIKLENNL